MFINCSLQYNLYSLLSVKYSPIFIIIPSIICFIIITMDTIHLKKIPSWSWMLCFLFGLIIIINMICVSYCCCNICIICNCIYNLHSSKCSSCSTWQSLQSDQFWDTSIVMICMKFLLVDSRVPYFLSWDKSVEL